ncbi:MAG: acyltransferase family protein [Candidatus Nanopelagicales bacterium]|nr:acyltransferase family protein [Candidatus Nanopelagicales bacterium]
MTTGSPAAQATPAASDNRRNDIQGLRAVAVGFVVAFHAGLPVPGGFVGVDVFFVISGFVITAMLAREWVRTQTLRFSTFYARRFRRLTPALALLVGSVVVMSALIQSPMGEQQIAAKTGLGALLLIANVVIARTTGGYFDAPAETNPLLNTWSLSVEEQFYLVFPLILYVGWRLARRFSARWVPVALVGGIAGVSFAIAMLEASGHRIPLMPTVLGGFYGPVSRAWEFAAGALLALLAARIEPVITRAVGTVLASLGIIGLAASLVLVSAETVWPGPMTILPVVSTMLLLVGGYAQATLPSRVLGTRPLVAIGNLSYSWYLWHWPFIVFALALWPTTPGIALAAAIASLVPSILSYRWVEQPIRGLRDVGRARMTRIVSLTMIPPIALAGGLWIAADQGFWNPRVQQFVASVAPMHAGNKAGCNESIAPSDRKASVCVWNADGAGTPVYLIGDSHADHFSEAVIAATGATDSPLTIATANACPFYDVHLRSAAAPRSPCRQFVQKTLAWLDQQPPGIVLIGTSAVYWNSRVYSAGATAAAVTNEPAAKRAALQAGLQSTVEQLQASGHRVVLIQDVPFFASPYASNPQRFSVLDIASGRDLGEQMPQDIADRNQRVARSAVTAVADATGASVLDLRPELCPAGQCSTQLDGVYLYRDDGHISVGADALLGTAFERALKGR